MKKIFLIFCASLFLSAQASLFQDINLGINEFYSNDYSTALKSFNAYVASNPNDADGYFWLAKTYQKLNNKLSANENFKKAYEITKKDRNIEKINFDFNSNLEDYFDMALAYFEAGNYIQADFYADLMLRLDSKSKSAYFIKAKIAQTKGDNDKAVEYLTRAILFDNKLLNTNLAKSLNIVSLPKPQKEVYQALALQAYFEGDINTALNNYKQARMLDNKDVEIINNIVDLYLKNNNLTLAKQNALQALKLDNNNFRAHLNQAKIYEITKDKKLENELLKAYKINPNNKEVLIHLANFYLKKEDYLLAKEYFKTLIDIDDNNYEAYFGYIFSLIELGEIEEASICFKKKMNTLRQKNGEAEFLLAKICIDAKEYPQALDFLKDALKKEDSLYYRAEIERVKTLMDKENKQ